jgi:hypothetical protein
MPSESFAALHAARIKGVLAPDLLVRLVSAETIASLEKDGLMRQTARGYALTAQGLTTHAALLADEHAATDLGRIEACYERFLAMNGSVKGVCAAWQQSHDDEDELWHTADQLTQYLGRVGPSLRQAGSILPRFEIYVQRLSAATEKATEGDARFVTDPAVDSFHNVWFECHEDYLLTLGRDREQEES